MGQLEVADCEMSCMTGKMDEQRRESHWGGGSVDAALAVAITD